jgi:hypothetical protein
MISFYIALFFASLAGLVMLFSLKYVEVASGRIFMPNVRQALDAHASRVRRGCMKLIHVVEHLPAFTVLFGYWILHILAVLVALSARSVERQAHRSADFISHRRKYERRETQSSFLKEVSSHKDSIVVPDDVTKI